MGCGRILSLISKSSKLGFHSRGEGVEFIIPLRKMILVCSFGIVCSLALPGAGSAAGNPSVSGKVIVYDRQGNIKEDQSGIIIFLDEVNNPAHGTASPKNAVMHQLNKQFTPDVFPIEAGTTVDFPNDDTIFHNVFSLSKTKPFDLGLYKRGSSKLVTFDKPGLVKVYCNIHPNMIAYILVLPNPYFSVSDKNGNFVIPNVPPGSATVRTWNPRSKNHPEKAVDITVEGLKDLNLSVVVENLEFKISEETVSVEHTNKWGQDYPAKY